MSRSPTSSSPSSLGFSLGNNQGADRASGDVLHFLNSDTRLLQTNALQRLADELAEPGVGLVGPRLENPDGALQSSCRAHPTLVRALVVGTGLHRLLPNALLARLFSAGWSHDKTRHVDWVVGAVLSVRADVFPHVAGSGRSSMRRNRSWRARFSGGASSSASSTTCG